MELNVRGFYFVDQLQVSLPSNTKDETQKPKVIFQGEKVIADLGEVSNLQISEVDITLSNISRRFVGINGNMVGLEKAVYKEFENFILEIYRDSFYSDKTDYETLREIVWDWVICVYKAKAAEKSLATFIIDEIDTLTKEYVFGFCVEHLHIEENFKLGNCEFKFFPEEEIQDFYRRHYEKYPQGNTVDELHELYKKNFESVNVIVIVNGILNRAKEIALREAENSVNVLKCFCSDYCINPLVKCFEISHNFQQSLFSTSIYSNNEQTKMWKWEGKFNRQQIPIQLSKQWMNQHSKGLTKFSKFIECNSYTQYYDCILELISQFSNIVSTPNDYQKIIKSISLFETIAIPIKENGKTDNGKAITNLNNKVLKTLFTEHDLQILKPLIICHYEIRNKFLHNNLQFPIYPEKLRQLLLFQRYFIERLIDLNKQFKTLAELWDYFNLKY